MTKRHILTLTIAEEIDSSGVPVIEFAMDYANKDAPDVMRELWMATRFFEQMPPMPARYVKRVIHEPL